MALIARNVDTGEIVADKVGVAATHAARAVGLLKRAALEAGEALWIVPSRGVHTWGMRFSIDVIALDERGVVIDCVLRLKPWRIRLPRRGTAGVLELPVGALERSRTAIGHRIEFESVAPAPPPRSDQHVVATVASDSICRGRSGAGVGTRVAKTAWRGAGDPAINIEELRS
jgi:uncharacterized membrane protein (UPF0127 family)